MPESVLIVVEDGRDVGFARTHHEARKFMAHRVRQRLDALRAADSGAVVHASPVWDHVAVKKPGLYVVYAVPAPPLDINMAAGRTNAMYVRCAREETRGSYFTGYETTIVWEAEPVVTLEVRKVDRVTCAAGVADAPVPARLPDACYEDGQTSRRPRRGLSPFECLLNEIEARGRATSAPPPPPPPPSSPLV